MSHTIPSANDPKWSKDAYTLFDSVCKYASWLADACNTCRPGEPIGEQQLSELRKSLYLARLDGYIEAIEAFTGIHYNFTITDDYYGICDDDEDFIYKVPLHPKIKEAPPTTNSESFLLSYETEG